MRKLKAYLRPSLTTFCPIFFQSACRKNGEEYEPTTVFSFEHLSQRYLIEKKYPHLTYSSTISSKNPEKSCSEAKSRYDEHSKGTRLTASSSRRALFEALFEAGEFRDSNPVVFQRSLLRFPSKRQHQSSGPLLIPPLQLLQVQSQDPSVHNIPWYCELSRMKGSVELLSRAMRTIDMIDY